MTLNPERWTIKTQEALAAAVERAREASNAEVSPAHLLAAGATSAFEASRARSTAAASASWVLIVQRSGLSVIGSLRFRVGDAAWCG